jgi:hypothetical protein
MAPKRPKRPRDPNQLGKLIVELSTGEKTDVQPEAESDITPAQAFARSGGLRGGKARAESLTAEARSKIAAKAARARWAKQRSGGKD